MNQFLNNPVFYSLTGTDAHLGYGSATAKYFDEEVSPFAGFDVANENGFAELHDLLPAGRRILYARRTPVVVAEGWNIVHVVPGIQFVHTDEKTIEARLTEPTPLTEDHVDEMLSLATLTKPGPFAKRTIDFGHYYGFFENGRLAAMAGQRLHAGNYTEISAVCTHPDFLGKGYAAKLLLHQARLIRELGNLPFLHVRADNARAIAIYERTGFQVNGEMYFHVMDRL
ncbi:MAG: GNAT family N-acetyltransferase [Flavisolibacter sp.]